MTFGRFSVSCSSLLFSLPFVSMKIAQDKIDEIRSANDIVDVVAAHVKLKKRGKNFVGLCPFHTEKTPSFTVSPEKQVYHCFGCGKGGNVYTFVMEMEKVSFVESVRTLAERVGIGLPIGERDEDQASEHENLYHACRFAGLQFYSNLTKTDEGRAALEYFHQRGLTDEIIRSFGLGYSLHAWDSLLETAKAEGLDADILLKAGLLRRREDGSYYDYFRGRAMFPIFSTSGRVLAFGARKMREDDPLGKYINSPETPIYNKSRVLFGLFHSKDAIRGSDQALLVEGYVDLISLYQAGVQNVVATSGTALTEDQLRLLSRYTRNLTLVYDADSAGSNATIRGIDLGLEQGFDVKVAALPVGDDPDSFVRKHGGKEFEVLNREADSFIDFKAKECVRAGAFSTPEGKAEAVRAMVQTIAKVGDELKRNFYIKHVAEKYEVYESILHREMEHWRGKEVRSMKRQLAVAPHAVDAGVSVLPPERTPREGIPAAERDLLKLLLEYPREMIDLIFSHIDPKDFSDDRVRKIVHLLLDRFERVGSVEPTTLLQEIEDPSLKSIITDVSLSKYAISKRWQTGEVEIEEGDPWEIARGALATLKRILLQKQVEENQRRLKEATQHGGDALPFVQRHQELLKQIKELETATFMKES